MACQLKLDRVRLGDSAKQDRGQFDQALARDAAHRPPGLAATRQHRKDVGAGRGVVKHMQGPAHPLPVRDHELALADAALRRGLAHPAHVALGLVAQQRQKPHANRAGPVLDRQSWRHDGICRGCRHRYILIPSPPTPSPCKRIEQNGGSNGRDSATMLHGRQA